VIDPNWAVVDLDPRTWRSLGRFFDPAQYVGAAQPGEHGLFVLHAGGRRLRVVDTRDGVRNDLAPAHIDNPHTLAHDLYESGEWDRVHVIDKQHLAHVSRQAQAPESRALSLEAYYHRVYELLWRSPAGYASVPPHPGHWHGWTLSALREFAARLPASAAAALAVLDGATVNIGLVLEFDHGVVVRVTTFDGLRLAQPPRLSADFLGELWVAVSEQIAVTAAALVCSQAAFDEWLEAGDKRAALRALRERGEAFWQLRPATPPSSPEEKSSR